MAVGDEMDRENCVIIDNHNEQINYSGVIKCDRVTVGYTHKTLLM
jgi:hypothetical protein